MYCKNCGSQINDNANVCGYCGTPVHTQNCFSNNQQQNNTASGQQVYGEQTPSYSGSTQNSNYQNSGQNMNQGYNGQQYQNNGYPNQNQGYGAPQPSNMDGVYDTWNCCYFNDVLCTIFLVKDDRCSTWTRIWNYIVTEQE